MEKNLPSLVWLIEHISQSGECTLDELNRYLSYYYPELQPLDRRQLTRKCEKIRQLFGIDIAKRIGASGRNHYYIADPEQLQRGSVKHQIIQTLATGEILRQFDDLLDYVLLESQPEGNLQLAMLLPAMRSNHWISLQYDSVRHGCQEQRVVQPWALRYFETRWYLLGVNENEDMQLMPLDRMADIEILPPTFQRPDGFTAKTFFAPYYGVVIGPDTPAETVIRFRAIGPDVKRFLSNPIHDSQQLLKSGAGWAEFEIHCHPTDDLLGRFASRTFLVRILSPEPVVTRFLDLIRKTLKLYEL